MKPVVLAFIFIFPLGVIFAGPAIQLPVYSKASCQALKGTWKGFMTNPSDLYSPSSKRAIVRIQVNDQNVVGQVNHQYFWAHCVKGILSKIALDNPAHCGVFSNEGALIAKSALVFKMHEQNAMMDWDWWFFLRRISDTALFALPAKKTVNALKTCH